MKVRDFGEVQQRVEVAARRLGTDLQTIGEVDGYPILHLTFGTGIPVWLDAGIHGEEPGSVAGLLSFLEGPAAAYAGRLRFDVYPCLNPYGYERNHRLNARGDDPNRQFKNPLDPLRSVLDRAVGEERHVLSLDFHEDSDFYGAYIYETFTDGERYAPVMRDAIAQVGPVTARSETPPSWDGLVRFGDDENLRARREEMLAWDTWPIAMWLFVHHSSHQITVETPGHQPLAVRAAMHVAAATTALDHLLAQR